MAQCEVIKNKKGTSLFSKTRPQCCADHALRGPQSVRFKMFAFPRKHLAMGRSPLKTAANRTSDSWCSPNTMLFLTQLFGPFSKE